ncbi:hypothetical protein [Aliiroseovarius sp. YM-037]|uniref:hypothetical protein n=1 Tax=Aliiroseovarius sp. YM-037 TaxID=3341728 RepID=UPI003A7FC852
MTPIATKMVFAAFVATASAAQSEVEFFCSHPTPNGNLASAKWDALDGAVASCSISPGQSATFLASPEPGAYELTFLGSYESAFYFLADEIRIEEDGSVYFGTQLARGSGCEQVARVYIPADGIHCAFRQRTTP